MRAETYYLFSSCQLWSFSFFNFIIIFMNFIFCLRIQSISLIFIRSKLWSTDRRCNSFSLGWFLKTLLTITDLHSQLAGIFQVRCFRWSWIFDFRVETLLLLKILRRFPHDLAIYCSVGNQIFNVIFLDLYITILDLVSLSIIDWWARTLFALIFIIFLRGFQLIRNLLVFERSILVYLFVKDLLLIWYLKTLGR